MISPHVNINLVSSSLSNYLLTGLRWNLEERVGREGPILLRTLPIIHMNVCGFLNIL